jgi:putative ABC transport system ATP-binding protein
MIEARNLSRFDPRTATQLLNPTDYSLLGADRVAITGSSGSGKSVFLRTLALLDTPSTGEVLWKNAPIPHVRIPTYRSRVCYISQKPGLIEGTVEDNLRYPFSLKVFARAQFDRQVVEQLLEKAGKTPQFIDKQSSDLSGGEAQIVALIRTLQLQPEVLLLDEPTAALDPNSSEQVEHLVSAWFAEGEGGRAYIWVSHDHDQARRMSDYQMTMHAGTLTGRQAQ